MSIPRHDIAVECRTCGRDYSQRENLLTGEWLWFPNCKCPVSADSAKVVVLPTGGYANRNDDGDMSDGGRTRAEVLEAPEDDEMTEAGFREGYGHG